MHILCDPMENLSEALTTIPRKNQYRYGGDLNKRAIFGDMYVLDRLKENSEKPVPDRWEIWVAESPRRLVVYFGDEEKRPWEPGKVMLMTGWNRFHLNAIRKAYRILCLNSWNLHMSILESEGELYAESSNQIENRPELGDS